jgi:cardiolipin synthase
MWVKILFIVYLIALVYTVIRILLDTDSTPKTLAYLLLVFVFPVFGMVFYFSLGVNYRHQKSTAEGVAQHYELDHKYQKEVADHTHELLRSSRDEIGHFEPLIRFLRKIGGEHLSQSRLSLLINGEEKFPDVLETLERAEHHIHMEYYAWENDQRGNQIKDVLLKKIAQGVRVRVLYDDFASAKIKKNVARELKEAGAEIYPQIKVLLWQLANRLNHRDHRKIIIVDGTVGFVGGINVSDRYDNSIDTGLFWRDTHVKITGPLVRSLQRHFTVSWNTSTPAKVEFGKDLFPDTEVVTSERFSLGQIVAGGPIYPKSNIMLSYFKIFTLAREKLYVTNPYFIPSDSIMDALKQAALSGVDVRLLLPFKSDSKIVGAASRFYFSDLLDAGVRIFLYKKGFVHAKTLVCDSMLSVVGTANMDIRSFDLNFEIMSVIYDKAFAHELENAFLKDLDECLEVNPEDWKKRGFLERLVYSVARLISSLL